MTVSVVIPCLDSAEYLGATLISLLNQTRQPAEIIVADNGSTDGSLDIARSFPQVTLIEVPEPGAPAARNAGAELAQGSSLMFLDADDLIGPETLAVLEDALQAGTSDIACCPWYRYEFAAGIWSVAHKSCPPRLPGDDALAAWLSGWYQPPCSILWSRQAFARSGGWDNRVKMNQDGDIMMRGLVAGNRLRRTDEGAAYYRRLPGERSSISSKRKTRKGIESRLFVLERIVALMEKEGIARRYAPALVDAYDALANDVAVDNADLAPRIRVERERFERSGRRNARLARSALRGLTGPATFFGSRMSLGKGAPAAPPESARISPPVCSDRSETGAQPLVSVVIPAYNRAETIRRSVDSVLQQDYRKIELLVVDDASSDGTLDMLRQQPDPRLRVIRQPSNGGVGAARNRGIEEARGDFIAFLDSDDEWLPGKLSRQMAAFENAPGRVGMIVTGVENRFKDGATAIQRAHRNGGWFETLLLRNTLHGAPSSGVFRREVFEVVGGFDPRLPAIEDYELWLRISRFFDIASIDEPLVRYFDMADFSDSRSDAMRVSRNFEKNRAARRILFERYGFEMKRRGVDHLFLLDSSMRELADPAGSKMRAAIQATKAVARRPLAPYSYRWLLTQFAPRMVGN